MVGNNSFKVGLYIRLSRDDGNIESDSIVSQRSLLNQYVKENNYIVVDEYVDDGYSGTNFDRPSFKRMMKDIELGKINMIITKDMSRLGRDYIGTGELIEKYFPNNNIRYIAINDGIDTFIDNTNNDIAPFKAIMNDFYAKDISKKIKSSLKAKMKDGKYVGGRAPFGYTKDKDNKNQLIVDSEQAIVVKRIFDMALNLLFDGIERWLMNRNTVILLPMWWEGEPFISGIKDGEKILLIPAEGDGTEENTGEEGHDTNEDKTTTVEDN